MPAPDGNPLAIQPPNILGSSTDKTARSTPAVSKLLSKPQNNQTSINTKDQFYLYTWAQQELNKVTNIPPNTADIKELDELAKKIANLWNIINLIKPSRRLSSKEYKLYGKYIH